MCGIYGYKSFNQKKLSDVNLLAMSDAIYHRGPDAQGIFHDVSNKVALGNNRLAIIDVDSGNQPFYSSDGNIVVVQNGEIFNHVELANDLRNNGYEFETHSDTEVILALYETEGINFIHKLNGMFAIAIYDKRNDELFLIRDRVGEKPLYYFLDEGMLIFASEIKSISKVCSKRNISHDALNQFLAFNYVPPPLTMLDGVRHVMPGSYLSFKGRKLKEFYWWRLSDQIVKVKSEKEYISEFNSILSDAVNIRLRCDVPFGAFLSGGVDSSTVVGLMSGQLDSSVKTFCIGFDDPRFDESPFAQEAAERFNTEHTVEIVAPNMIDLWPMATYHCDQPHGDISFLPTYKVSSLAADHVKVVLTGDGADELFAGYDKYKNFFSNNLELSYNESSFREAYLNNITLFDNFERKKLFKDSVKLNFDLEVNPIIDSLLNEVGHMDKINQALYIDMMLLLPGNNLVKPDRMGMAVSIENRSPFLDYRMMEFAFQIPGDLKLNNGETKYIYKKAVKDLIGHNLAYRKKQMFTVPVGEWFKNDLRGYCENLLFSEDSHLSNFFNIPYIKKIFDDHINNVKNYTREIRALLAIELWLKNFYEES